MLLSEIALASTDVAATSSRLAKIERLAACLVQAAPDEVAIAVAYLSGVLPQGTVGVGWAALRRPSGPGRVGLPEAARGRCGDHTSAAHLGRGLAGSSAKRARGAVLSRDRVRAAPPRRALSRRASPRSARGRDARGGREGRRRSGVGRAACGDARRRRVDGRGGRHARGRPGSGTLPADAAAADHADAGSDRRGRDRRAREAGSRERRMEARRRAYPGTPCGRRRARVHPQPRRHHRARAGDRRSASRVGRLGNRPRRRGDRAP